MAEEMLGSLERPEPRRVAKRALSLCATAAWGTFAEHPKAQANSLHRQLLGWCEHAGLWEEMDPSEAKLIRSAPGKASASKLASAVWRVEGASILAWALKVHTLPPIDSAADALNVFLGLGYLQPAAAEIVARAKLRPAAQIDELAERLRLIHWRLVEFGQTGKPASFASFARKLGFASIDPRKFPLIDGDLAFNGLPLAALDEEGYFQVITMIEERRRAALWLEGFAERYLDVDLSA